MKDAIHVAPQDFGHPNCKYCASARAHAEAIQERRVKAALENAVLDAVHDLYEAMPTITVGEGGDLDRLMVAYRCYIEAPS